MVTIAVVQGSQTTSQAWIRTCGAPHSVAFESMHESCRSYKVIECGIKVLKRQRQGIT